MNESINQLIHERMNKSMYQCEEMNKRTISNMNIQHVIHISAHCP